MLVSLHQIRKKLVLFCDLVHSKQQVGGRNGWTVGGPGHLGALFFIRCSVGHVHKTGLLLKWLYHEAPKSIRNLSLYSQSVTDRLIETSATRAQQLQFGNTKEVSFHDAKSGVALAS